MKIRSHQIKFKDFFFTIGGIIISMMVYVLLHAYKVEEINLLYTDIQGYKSHYNLNLSWISIVVFLFFVLLNIFYLQLNIFKREMKEITESMRYANTHILNTFIYQTQILRIEASGIPEFNKDIIDIYNKSVEEALIQSKKISSLKRINQKAVLDCLIIPN
jgi:hypothetical protein